MISATQIRVGQILKINMMAKVPLFIKPGDYVVIDTASGNYLEKGWVHHPSA